MLSDTICFFWTSHILMAVDHAIDATMNSSEGYPRARQPRLAAVFKQTAVAGTPKN